MEPWISLWSVFRGNTRLAPCISLWSVFRGNTVLEPWVSVVCFLDKIPDLHRGSLYGLFLEEIQYWCHGSLCGMFLRGNTGFAPWISLWSVFDRNYWIGAMGLFMFFSRRKCFIGDMCYFMVCF